MQGGDHGKRGYLHHDHRERAAEYRNRAGCYSAEHFLSQIHEHRGTNGKVRVTSLPVGQTKTWKIYILENV